MARDSLREAPQESAGEDFILYINWNQHIILYTMYVLDVFETKILFLNETVRDDIFKL